MLAPGRALPGVEQSWGGRGPAPRRAPFCCEVKDGGWDFPRNPGAVETSAGAQCLRLPPGLC